VVENRGSNGSRPLEAEPLPERPAVLLRLGPRERWALVATRILTGALLALAVSSFALLLAWGSIVVLGRSIDDEALARFLVPGGSALAVVSGALAIALVRRAYPPQPDELLLFGDRIETFAQGSLDRFFFRQLDELELVLDPRGRPARVVLSTDRGATLEVARPWPLEAVIDHLSRDGVPGVLARTRGLLDLGDEFELRAVGRSQERRLRSEGFSGLYLYAASVLFLARFFVELGRHEIAPFETLDLPFFFVFAAFGLGLRWESKRGLAARGLVLTRSGVRASGEPRERELPWRELRFDRTAEGLRLEAPGRAPLVYSARGSNFRFLGDVLAELPRIYAADAVAPTA
jgi:hypothetical protein